MIRRHCTLHPTPHRARRPGGPHGAYPNLDLKPSIPETFHVLNLSFPEPSTRARGPRGPAWFIP
eukprot:CAMPEP_0180315658 /NCGR_PEP_ID=MMETSP0988-20121125/32799_1 /TAXON_ID=697907 /ORGANISM="non described non described, Strain CCMP2293" /LENGTH=63 /DNA_ID=CAMNT_0022300617 /DNA_START=34 /DNA_END=225 /DNA_ORIENTATION=-